MGRGLSLEKENPEPPRGSILPFKHHPFLNGPERVPPGLGSAAPTPRLEPPLPYSACGRQRAQALSPRAERFQGQDAGAGLSGFKAPSPHRQNASSGWLRRLSAPREASSDAPF